MKRKLTILFAAIMFMAGMFVTVIASIGAFFKLDGIALTLLGGAALMVIADAIGSSIKPSTLPPATSDRGDADETDGARNIKNDAGEASRKDK